MLESNSFGDFVKVVDCAFKDIQADLLHRNTDNVFSVYMIDFTWKVIQARLAVLLESKEIEKQRALLSIERFHKHKHSQVKLQAAKTDEHMKALVATSVLKTNAYREQVDQMERRLHDLIGEVSQRDIIIKTMREVKSPYPMQTKIEELDQNLTLI